MTATPPSPAVSQQAAVDAALLVLKSMGLSLDDLTAAPGQRAPVPTFADYVPVVSATVTSGTRKAYGSYWNRRRSPIPRSGSGATANALGQHRLPDYGLRSTLQSGTLRLVVGCPAPVISAVRPLSSA